MALYDYIGALRKGRKAYQAAVAKGEYPYLPVLDDILANTDIASEVNLGLIDVPLERIVGTKTKGRTEAFASNFMPLLGERTEFGAKWSRVYEYQIEEGIQDPIVAYEFMNRYYVLEGNKRVSVLKYVHAYSITASVIRMIPRRSDDRNVRLYYEFLDFYQVSFNCDVWFSTEGSYDRLLAAMGKEKGVVWDQEDQKYFKAVYDLFSRVFETKRTGDMDFTASDAFLVYVEILGYDTVKRQTEGQIRKGLDGIWDEVLLRANGGRIALVEEPEKEDNSAVKLFDWLMPAANIEPEMLKIAFIYQKSKETSSWAYGHELGRMYLEQCFDGKLRTVAFENAGTEEEIASALNLAVAAGCNVIFTTSPQMAAQSVKMAVQRPDVRIYNCSVNMSYSSICTYYARMHETKFLMGALAAAMSESDKLGYIAGYSIYGTIANINAFALGAKMINPRSKVYLTWSRLKGADCQKELAAEGISYISGDDMITPVHASREYGLYHRLEDGSVENIAMALCDWGKFYEKIVRNICHGASDVKEQRGKQAVNYWWGMSADVLDVICSGSVPDSTSRLIRFLKSSIRSGEFAAFAGKLSAQNGVTIGSEDDDRGLGPEEIITMDWLLDNVTGRIPDVSEFPEELQPVIRAQSGKLEEKGMEGQKVEGTGISRS